MVRTAAVAVGIATLIGCEQKPKPIIEVDTPKAKIEVHKDGDAVQVDTKKKTP